MSLEIVTEPSVEPISLAEAKAHLRVDLSYEDSQIQGWIKAARQHCEEYLQRTLLYTEYRFYLDEFPCECPHEIRLPKPRAQHVSSVKYLNSSGTLTTLSASAYRVSLYSEPARIAPAFGYYWPVAQWTTDAVQVEYSAGYGTYGLDPDPAQVPEPIRAAMKLHMALNFEERGDGGQPGNAKAVMERIAALLDPYRVWEYR